MRKARTILLYISPFIVIGLLAKLLDNDKDLLASGIAIAYLAFVFKIDKLKVSKDGIEVSDEHKD